MPVVLLKRIYLSVSSPRAVDPMDRWPWLERPPGTVEDLELHGAGSQVFQRSTSIKPSFAA